MSKVVQFPQEPPEEDDELLLMCADCKCMTFMICEDGECYCAGCEQHMPPLGDDQPRSWGRRDTDIDTGEEGIIKRQYDATDLMLRRIADTTKDPDITVAVTVTKWPDTGNVRQTIVWVGSSEAKYIDEAIALLQEWRRKGDTQ